MPSHDIVVLRRLHGVVRTKRRFGKPRLILIFVSALLCLIWIMLQSTLEFELRLQEVIELARQRRNEEAIVYMKKHLVQWQETHFEEIIRVSALLAFPPTTTCGPYKVRLVNTLSTSQDVFLISVYSEALRCRALGKSYSFLPPCNIQS